MEGEGVEGVSDFVGNPCGEEGEGIELFGFELFFGFLSRVGEVADKHDVSEVGFIFVGDGGAVEVKEAVFGVEDFEVAVDGSAWGVEKGGPIDTANDLVEGLALGVFGGEAKELAGGVIDEANFEIGGEEEDSFLESLEDLLEESFLADESDEEGLKFAGVDLIESGEDFFEDGGFHGCVKMARIARGGNGEMLKCRNGEGSCGRGKEGYFGVDERMPVGEMSVS